MDPCGNWGAEPTNCKIGKKGETSLVEKFVNGKRHE
jgi:hypothetical protein